MSAATGMMHAAVWRGPETLEIARIAPPAGCGPDDALVRVTWASLCGTDVHAWRGAVPGFEAGTVLGHEFVGQVVAVGSAVAALRAGDLVCASDFAVCGRCPACRRGRFVQCAERRLFGFSGIQARLDGGLAEFVRVPHADVTLGRPPAGLDPRLTVLAADVLPTALCALDACPPVAGQPFAVIGCGPVGLLVQWLAIRAGALVHAFDTVPERLERARRVGSEAVDADPERIGAFAAGFEVVVDAAGGRAALALALRLAGAGATVVGVGSQSGVQELDVGRMMQREIRLHFVLGDPVAQRERAFALLAEGAVPADLILSEAKPLSAVPDLLRRLAARQGFKPLIAVAPDVTGVEAA